MKIKTTALIISFIFLHIPFTMGQKMDTKVYSNIPVQLREKASVAFIGTFYTGRGPCQTYTEGKRRWRLIKGFKIDNDILGNINIKEIEIHPYLLNDSIETGFNLINGKQYCILLNPGAEKFKYITGNLIPFDYYNHIISSEEIIIIVKVELAF